MLVWLHLLPKGDFSVFSYFGLEIPEKSYNARIYRLDGAGGYNPGDLSGDYGYKNKDDKKQYISALEKSLQSDEFTLKIPKRRIQNLSWDWH